MLIFVFLLVFHLLRFRFFLFKLSNDRQNLFQQQQAAGFVIIIAIITARKPLEHTNRSQTSLNVGLFFKWWPQKWWKMIINIYFATLALSLLSPLFIFGLSGCLVALSYGDPEAGMILKKKRAALRESTSNSSKWSASLHEWSTSEEQVKNHSLASPYLASILNNYSVQVSCFKTSHWTFREARKCCLLARRTRSSVFGMHKASC